MPVTDDMRLMLGSAQFGLDYGVTNKAGITVAADVSAILEVAKKSGVRFIDTAYLYGKSESVLGGCASYGFEIVTKTPRFNAGDKDGQSVLSAFEISSRRLKRNKIYGLLFHSSEDLLGRRGGCLYRQAENLKTLGKVKKIGVSVYRPEEADKLAQRFPLDLIQLPYNVLDQRAESSGLLTRLKKYGMEIHARSVFLQGLLLSNVEDIPDKFRPLKPLLRGYHDEIKAYGLTPLEASLAFARRNESIDRIIVGVNNTGQFAQIVEAYSSAGTLDLDLSRYSSDDESMINPSLW